MTAITKYTVTALLVIAGFTSCKKGWLEVTSRTQVREDDLFKTEAGCKDALIGAYIGMTAPELYAKEATWALLDVASLQYNSLTESAEYQPATQFNYKHIRIVNKVDGIWNNAYSVIANVNNTLAGMDKNKGAMPGISYSIIKGELLGLRAFLHFDLLRMFGYGNIANRPEVASKLAIPYVTTLTKEVTPQRSYTETFNLLMKDIQDALELLKEDPVYKVAGRPADYYATVNRDGFFDKREQRMNYYAVKALQARALLWQGGAVNLANARLAAEEVINASPAKLITPATSPASDRLLYAEHLFNLNITDLELIINVYLTATRPDLINSIYLTRSSTETLYETSNTNIGLVDKRYNTLLESQTLGLVPVKLYQKTGSPIDILPLVTLPEMYYIAAEYYVANDLPKAIEYLNKVRSSRGILQQIAASATATVVNDELFKEYRKEFVSAGQLFFYYKRLGRTTFPGLPTTRTADDKVYLLPYPDDEIRLGNRVQ